METSEQDRAMARIACGSMPCRHIERVELFASAEFESHIAQALAAARAQERARCLALIEARADAEHLVALSAAIRGGE